MKYRLIGLSAVLAFALLTFVGVALASGPEAIERYHQHEQARSLDDLSPEERRAAISTSTDAATFATHLPIVSIRTDGQPMPGRPIYDVDGKRAIGEDGVAKDTLAEDGARTMPVSLSLYDDGEESPEVANRLSDRPLFTTQAELRIRGHSSSRFDKSSYRVTFTLEDRATANPQEVLGMGVEEDWVLHGPYLDKTLIRNYLSMNLFGELLPYTPDVRFAELFLDGAYQGVYVLMESVAVGEDRVDLRPTDRGAIQTSFLVARDWHESFGSGQIEEFADRAFKVLGTGVDIRYPVERNLTAEQREWIVDTINQIEKDLYSYDYDTDEYGYWTNLDVDSFVDYAIVNEFSLNDDAGKFSTFYYKDLGGRLAIGPLWDFNNAYDNGQESSAVDSIGLIMLDKPIYSMLFRDERFTQRFIDRWRELRAGPLATERVEAYIDDVVAYLGPAIARNYEVWGYTFEPEVLAQARDGQLLEPIERNPTSYGEAVEDLKRAIEVRTGWMDGCIESIRQYSHESAVKEFNH